MDGTHSIGNMRVYNPREELFNVSATVRARRKQQQPRKQQPVNIDTSTSGLTADPPSVSRPASSDTPTSRHKAGQTRASRLAATTSALRLADDDGSTGGEAQEREQLLDRLGSLRRVLPVLAQEMASARRQAARLRTDNRRLSAQVRELRAALEAREKRPT
jgi:hypothetical protein